MKFSKVILVTLLIPTMVACVSTPQAQYEPTTVMEPTPDEALQADAAEYAKQFGVSQEEALRRLRVQNEIGGLGAALQREQAETFAGLWIQHEPEFRVIAAFTRDGEQTIQPYLEEKSYADLVEIKTFPYSLRELESAQQQAIQIAEELEIPITSYISVQENRVTLVVGNPEMFQEEVRLAGRELPEPVEVVVIDPGHLTDTLRGGIETYPGPDGGMIYFPKQAPTNVYMAALFEGRLILDSNGCLRVASEGGDGRLILWHHDFALQTENDVIEVLNGEGQVVARVGEPVRMGGGETSAKAVPGLSIEACPGPYWALGDIETLEAQAIPDIYVEVIDVNTPEGNTFASQGLFLHQSKPAPEEDILSGRLTLDEDRCFRVGGYTLLWPPDVWPRQELGPFRFVRVEGETETTVAMLGEEVRLPGAERFPGDYRFFENKVQCEGPYWGVAYVEASTATPTPTSTQLPAWRQDELLIGKQVMPFSTDPLCEWDILGMEGRELYAWVYCQAQGEYGSEASVPAVITVGEDGQYEGVVIPGDGSNYCRDMLEFFPPEIRQAMQAYSHGKVDELITRAEARKAQDTPPQLYLTGTPRPEDQVYPTFTPYPTQSPLPPGLAEGYEPWLAFAGADGNVYLAGGETPEPKAIDVWGACIPGAIPLSWSPDGRYLAYPNPAEGPTPQLAIYDRTTGAIERYPIPSLRTYPTWSPDSQNLAWAQVKPDTTNYALAPQSGGYRAVDVRTVYTLSRRSGEVIEIDDGQRVWWTKEGALLYLKSDDSLWRSGPGGQDKKKIDLPIFKELDFNQLTTLEYDAGLHGLIFGEPGLAGEGLKIFLAPLDGSAVQELARLDGFPEMITQAHTIRVSPDVMSILVYISTGKPGEGGALTKCYLIRLADGQATEIQTFSGTDWLPGGQEFAGLAYEDMAIYLALTDSRQPELVHRALRFDREAISLGVDARHVYGIGWVWVEK